MKTASPLTTTHGLSRGSTTDLCYVVASPEYWDSIPQTRQLTCGRVRFTAERIVPPLGAGTYLLKAEAMLAMTEGQILVRETFLGNTSWHYQLLSKKQSPRE